MFVLFPGSMGPYQGKQTASCRPRPTPGPFQVSSAPTYDGTAGDFDQERRDPAKAGQGMGERPAPILSSIGQEGQALEDKPQITRLPGQGYGGY